MFNILTIQQFSQFYTVQVPQLQTPSQADFLILYITPPRFPSITFLSYLLLPHPLSFSPTFSINIYLNYISLSLGNLIPFLFSLSLIHFIFVLFLYAAFGPATNLQISRSKNYNLSFPCNDLHGPDFITYIT